MISSYITHEKGKHYKIDDNVLKLFDTLLDGTGRIDGNVFSDFFLCLMDCSLQWNYSAIEIKNFLYHDLCHFIEFYQETWLDDEKSIDFTQYFPDYPKRSIYKEINCQSLLDLQRFLLLCIKNNLSLVAY